MKEPSNSIAFYFSIHSETGRIPEDLQSQILAFQTAIGKSPFLKKASERIVYSERATFSHFLRIPLAEDFGGLPHRGMDVFSSVEDTDYQTLLTWVSK